jgi:NADH-quinone oxidoreductase subunit H
MVTASALMVTLFFGGWDIPFTLRDNLSHSGLWTIITGIVFFLKTTAFLFTFMWIRWTLPRFRYDQLMSLGWKVMLPMALAYIVVIAGAVLALDAFGIPRDWRYGSARIVLNVVCCAIVFLILDRGRVVSPASRAASPEELRRLRAISIPEAVPVSQGD